MALLAHQRLAEKLLAQGGSAEAHFTLARGCAQQGLFVTARDLLIRLLEIEPTHRYAATVLREVYLAAPAEMEQSARVSCSCCGGQLPKFVPGGVRLRPNARCPLCGSLERHRLLGLFLQERLSSVNRLLHIAPETCLRPMIDTFVAETVRGDLDPGHDQVRVDITAIEYPDGHFDAVLCNHVLEHVPDDTRAMSELFRVLSPGGWAVLQVPIDHTRNTTYEDPTITSPEERALAFGQHDHVRWYGLDYADRLRSAGFKVHSLDFAAAVGLETVEQFGLDSSETLFFCTKE